jgi:hypothetical protein
MTGEQIWRCRDNEEGDGSPRHIGSPKGGGDSWRCGSARGGSGRQGAAPAGRVSVPRRGLPPGPAHKEAHHRV